MQSRLSAALLIAFASLSKPVEAQPENAPVGDAGVSDIIVVTADPNRILPNAPSA